MDNMEFFFEESTSGLVPRVAGGVFLSGLVAGDQLTEGGTSGTEDAEEDLISSQPMGQAGGGMDCEGAGMWAAHRIILATKGWAIPAKQAVQIQSLMPWAKMQTKMAWECQTQNNLLGPGGSELEKLRMRGSPALQGCLPLKLLSVHLSIKSLKNVVNPSIGTSFDSVEEGYEFYNLYSWEVGFGVRYAKSRLNVHRKKCMQDIVCACAGKPLQANIRSTRCGCNAMIRPLRSDDNGWYVCEHRADHNHDLSLNC